jgi:hypothetical protein
VHSKEQIIAWVESGGRSRSQHSQFGRSSSIFVAEAGEAVVDADDAREALTGDKLVGGHFGTSLFGQGVKVKPFGWPNDTAGGQEADRNSHSRQGRGARASRGRASGKHRRKKTAGSAEANLRFHWGAPIVCGARAVGPA